MIKYLLDLGHQHLKNKANNHYQIQLGAVAVLFLSHLMGSGCVETPGGAAALGWERLELLCFTL